MASAQLTDAKILGGSGSILMILLPIPYAGLALYIAGVVLVIIAVRRIASALGDQKIFNYALVSVILIVVGLAAGVAVVVLTGLASIIQLLNIFSTRGGTFGDFARGEIIQLITAVLGSILVGLLVFWGFSIASSVYLRRSFNAIGVRLRSSLFPTVGILYIIGAVLAIMLIGFIIWLVALILQSIAFFTLPTETPQQEPVGP
jgi:uncharacterized membrane protein